MTTDTAEPAATIPHEPALDGLRGLAVAAVVAFHLGHLGGGFLGVDLFFVLSGFLITSLLVTEHRATGRIDLGHFWVRRARRLLPAVMLLLAALAVAIPLVVRLDERLGVTSPLDLISFRWDALATLAYVANWRRAFGEISYFDLFTQPSPLDHTWSLAIEEQFYVVWPLVVTVLLGRVWARHDHAGRVKRLLVLAAGGAVASFALLALLWDATDTNRAYFGTDTRIGAILLGAVAAMLLHRRGRRTTAPSAAAEVAGFVALAFLAWSMVEVDGQTAWYYRGGLLAFTLAALVVVNAAVGAVPGLVGRALALAPLAALGRISYGVYLWHWPAITFLTTERTELDGLVLDALRLAVTLAASLLSYRFLEQPIRHGSLRGRPARIGTPAAFAACAILVVGATTSTIGGRTTDVALGQTTSITVPASVPRGAVKVMLVGDSGPHFLREGFEAVLAEHGHSGLAVGETGCSIVVPEFQSRFADGHVQQSTTGCDRRFEKWMGLLREYRPDVVVYYLANAGGLGEPLLDGEYVTDCDPPFDAYLAGALERELTALASTGARLVLTTSPQMLNFEDPEGSVREVACRNETYRETAERMGDVAVVDLHGWVAERDAAGENVRADVVHLDAEASRQVTEWMLPQLLAVAGRG